MEAVAREGSGFFLLLSDLFTERMNEQTKERNFFFLIDYLSDLYCEINGKKGRMKE